MATARVSKSARLTSVLVCALRMFWARMTTSKPNGLLCLPEHPWIPMPVWRLALVDALNAQRMMIEKLQLLFILLI